MEGIECVLVGRRLQLSVFKNLKTRYVILHFAVRCTCVSSQLSMFGILQIYSKVRFLDGN